MKKFAIALCGFILAISCDTRSNEQKAEDKLQAQRAYNPNEQGPGHETHENQFYISRGNPQAGKQMEAAAASGEPTENKPAGDTLRAKK